jgi:hypothetical protein
VREVAAARRESEARNDLRRALTAALKKVYPDDGRENLASRPRCATLTPHVLMNWTGIAELPANPECAELLTRAGGYFYGLAAYSQGRLLLEGALAINEKVVGSEHPDTAASLTYLALLLENQTTMRRRGRYSKEH